MPTNRNVQINIFTTIINQMIFKFNDFLFWILIKKNLIEIYVGQGLMMVANFYIFQAILLPDQHEKDK